MNENQKIVLSFDLDFTLVDNSEGVVNSFNYAMKKHDLPTINPVEIKKMIGMPLDEIFAKISILIPSILVSSFREYYGAKGIHEVILLPGIKKIIKKLKKNFVLGVITSKKQEMASQLLNYLKIDRFFDYILGETDDIKKKVDPKRREFLLNKYYGYKFVVIGDHIKDRQLAELVDCPFIGVLTGFHSAEELTKDSRVKVLILNSAADITADAIHSLV